MDVGCWWQANRGKKNGEEAKIHNSFELWCGRANQWRFTSEMNHNVIQLFHISSLRKPNNSIYRFRVSMCWLVCFSFSCFAYALCCLLASTSATWGSVVCDTRNTIWTVCEQLVCWLLAAQSFNYTFYWQKKMMDSRSELADGWAR